jgi:hypothetical protein
VSSTNRTPDEPGRGSVATGQNPVVPQGGNGAAGAVTPAGKGNGRAVEPADQRAGASGDPADQPDGAAAVTGSDIVAAESDGAGAGATPAAGPPDSVTTARFRLPSPADTRAGSAEAVDPAKPARPGAAKAGPPARAVDTPAKAPTGNGASASAAPGRSDPSAAESDGVGAGRREPTSPPPAPTMAPLPAPAVPAPGPAAAQPPPWRRIPGRDPGRSDVPAASPSDADRLLDEGPTAFLEAPRYAPASSGASGGESTVSETGGWVRASRSRPPRQAALQLKRLDPWSVLKLALVLAVVLFFIWLVAVGVLYGVLDGMGVWDRLNGTYADLVSGESQTGNTLISAGRVFGVAAVVGAINSLLFAVAVTVGAFVYNVSADLVGGIEVTLSERD